VLDRLLRRIWLLGVPVGLLGAAAVIAYARPWHDAGATTHEVTVTQAVLRPGAIVLVVVNNSRETVRVAQVILNDAFVDFRQSRRVVTPGAAERITVSYPWIPGESYDVQLMTPTGATIAYGIEEAEAGAQQA
jgi:archaellum component FlaF (FlaF/FlaG flagellin family)